MRTWCLAATAAVSLALGAQEAQATSTRGGGFADLSPSARAAALGGAQAALSEGSEALFGNPAGLLALARPEAVFSYADLFELGLVSHSCARLAWPFLGKEVEWDRGRIRKTRGRPPAEYCLGLGVSRLGTEIDREAYGETQVALGLAFRLPEHARGGISYRLLSARSEIPDVGATGHAIDVGVERDFGPLRFGATARALASAVNWDRGADDPIRPRWLFGLAWRSGDERIRVGAQADLGGERADLEQGLASVEIRPIPALTVRGGLRHHEDPAGTFDDPCGGVGLYVIGMRFDYAVDFPESDLGSTHRISAALEL